MGKRIDLKINASDGDIYVVPAVMIVNDDRFGMLDNCGCGELPWLTYPDDFVDDGDHGVECDMWKGTYGSDDHGNVSDCKVSFYLTWASDAWSGEVPMMSGPWYGGGIGVVLYPAGNCYPALTNYSIMEIGVPTEVLWEGITEDDVYEAILDRIQNEFSRMGLME